MLLLIGRAKNTIDRQSSEDRLWFGIFFRAREFGQHLYERGQASIWLLDEKQLGNLRFYYSLLKVSRHHGQCVPVKNVAFCTVLLTGCFAWLDSQMGLMSGNPDSKIREILACAVWNPANLYWGNWNPGLGIRNTAQGIPNLIISLTIGIRNLIFTDKESRIQNLESGIHCVESRIQDCLGFPYMGQSSRPH